MTLIATQTFISIVFVVTKTNSERARQLRRAHVPTRLMAHAARGNVSVARFRLWTMTLKTRFMRAEAGRYC